MLEVKISRGPSSDSLDEMKGLSDAKERIQINYKNASSMNVIAWGRQDFTLLIELSDLLCQ